MTNNQYLNIYSRYFPFCPYKCQPNVNKSTNILCFSISQYPPFCRYPHCTTTTACHWRRRLYFKMQDLPGCGCQGCLSAVSPFGLLPRLFGDGQRMPHLQRGYWGMDGNLSLERDQYWYYWYSLWWTTRNNNRPEFYSWFLAIKSQLYSYYY